MSLSRLASRSLSRDLEMSVLVIVFLRMSGTGKGSLLMGSSLFVSSTGSVFFLPNRSKRVTSVKGAVWPFLSNRSIPQRSLRIEGSRIINGLATEISRDKLDVHHVPQNRQSPENTVRNLTHRQAPANAVRSSGYRWRDVRQDKPVEKWLNNLKPSSSEPYLHYLKRFCEYAGLNPEEILKNAKSDKESVHDTLKAFRRKLESQGNSSNTLQQGYMSVRSFLSWNGVKLDKTPRAFKGRVRYESDRVLEPHEVARMISFAQSTRDKALVSMLCHGQRVGVLPALRYGMLR